MGKVEIAAPHAEGKGSRVKVVSSLSGGASAAVLQAEISQLKLLALESQIGCKRVVRLSVQRSAGELQMAGAIQVLFPA